MPYFISEINARIVVILGKIQILEIFIPIDFSEKRNENSF